MTEELVITDSAPTGIERDFIETEESRETRSRELRQGTTLSPVRGRATLTLTFPTVTDREHWIETHGAALARFLPPEEG